MAGNTQAPARAATAGSGIVLLTLASGQFLMALDSSVMNISIATVANDLGTTVTGIQTAITLYTLVMASLMITGGKVGQILGRRTDHAGDRRAGRLELRSRRSSAGLRHRGGAEVGGLQNTIMFLGSSIGTALVGAVLISALSSSFFAGSRTTRRSRRICRHGRRYSWPAVCRSSRTASRERLSPTRAFRARPRPRSWRTTPRPGSTACDPR